MFGCLNMDLKLDSGTSTHAFGPAIVTSPRQNWTFSHFNNAPGIQDCGPEMSAIRSSLGYMNISDFTIDIPQADLDDLAARLTRTRFPNGRATGWETGTDLDTMRRLTSYWAQEYDWRSIEARLNEFPHHLADGTLHFVHARSDRPDARPILLLHGWADSFAKYVGIIDALRYPVNADAPAFHVVVPSLPGFGFSEQLPDGDAGPETTAAPLVALMETLGYDRYFVHGGDWGSVVGQEVVRANPDRILGLHLTDIPFPNLFMVDRESVTDDEKTFLEALDSWSENDAAYVSIQSSRPLTLAYGLSDSPVGLAAWIVDHFGRLSDSLPSGEDLITNVMTYWVRNSIHSSTRLYSEGAAWDEDSGDQDWAGTEDWADTADWDQVIHVPTAIALFPRDIGRPPREFVERFFDVVRYTVQPRGGHFAALEVPELVVADIQAFAGDLEAG